MLQIVCRRLPSLLKGFLVGLLAQLPLCLAGMVAGIGLGAASSAVATMPAEEIQATLRLLGLFGLCLLLLVGAMAYETRRA